MSGSPCRRARWQICSATNRDGVATVIAADPPAAPAPGHRSRAPLNRWPRRLTAVSWAGWGAAVLALWAQYQLGVYDTVDWLWLPFEVVGATAGVAALAVGLAGAARGPRRWAALGWAVAGFAPVLLAALLVGYMFFEQGRKNLPSTQAHKVGRVAAVSLLKCDARARYPHRLETDRLVMYFDDRVTDSAGDVAAMDAHLARLEVVLGRPERARIHWVRGSALGMRGMSIHSVALGTAATPAGWADRHELAHSFLYQFSDPGSEPPMLLLEGWAMAVDGHPEPLAASALAARAQLGIWGGGGPCLRAVLAPDLYHVGTSFAYDLGGALVDFMLRRYGPDAFLRFYNAIRPETLDPECERAFGCGLDELERAFWADVEDRSAGR